MVETRLLDFVADNNELLKTDGLAFQLDYERSVSAGQNKSHWFIEMQQTKSGVPVRGANLFFRISHGNIIQFGSHLVAPVAIDTQPASKRENAFDLALREIGFSTSTRISKILQAGELLLLPYAADGNAAGEAYRGASGAGYAHRLAWRFVFRVAGDATTYEVLVDAKSNRVIQVDNLNRNADAVVDGGIFTGVNTAPETIVPMPFAAVSNGGAKVTDALGIYDYSGGTATVTLDGKYIRIADTCGSVSLSSSSGGNLHLGTDNATDCGSNNGGGAGNTRAARNGFYYLTRINRKASTYLPTNAWIQGKVTANMNINDLCNANWDGEEMNFFRSGTANANVSCANTGEIPAVFLHEWGHAMDQHSGGQANEYGSGEAVGDTFAFLEMKDACIGNGFYTNQNGCYNCDDACSGVRDVGAFSTHGAAAIAKPSTITANAGPNCDRYTCPYLAEGIYPYQGPMGYEGHCESYIAGSANWDLAQSLVSAHGESAGWAAMNTIWYASLTPSKSAYRVASGGKCNVNAQVDGCGSNNWYTVYLAADDDDGNLGNGTPNACRIWDAFDAHGIACGVRPACSGGGGGNVAPTAGFSSTTDALVASFTDSSSDSDGSIVSRAWTFGDGASSTQTNPSHTYAAGGSYSVTLTVTDNGGASDSHTASVSVTGGSSNQPPTAAFSSTSSGLTASFTDSSSDSDGTIASRAWNFGDGASSTQASPSHTYAAAGTYSVTLTVTDDDGASDSETATVTVSVDPGSTVLANGVAVTGLAGATGSDRLFTLVVPAGATNLKFVTSGASGDADLYVKLGSAPTTTSYTCKSEGATTAETCTIANPQAGTWHVLVHAYSVYSGLSLTGSFQTGSGGGSVLQNGVPVSGVGAAAGSKLYYTLQVPSGRTYVRFTTTGGSGDTDLYVQYGAAPTLTSYRCVSGNANSTETCTVYFPQAGTWHVMLNAYSTFSGVTLTGRHQ
jgi:PKD repeat protein